MREQQEINSLVRCDFFDCVKKAGDFGRIMSACRLSPLNHLGIYIK